MWKVKGKVSKYSRRLDRIRTIFAGWGIAHPLFAAGQNVFDLSCLLNFVQFSTSLMELLKTPFWKEIGNCEKNRRFSPSFACKLALQLWSFAFNCYCTFSALPGVLKVEFVRHQWAYRAAVVEAMRNLVEMSAKMRMWTTTRKSSLRLRHCLLLVDVMPFIHLKVIKVFFESQGRAPWNWPFFMKIAKETWFFIARHYINYKT